MKKSASLIIILISVITCTSLDSETEHRFKANKEFLENYVEELGYTDNPFLELIPENNLDSQRKKYIASLSEQELKTLAQNSISGVPKIETNSERGKKFLKETRNMKDQSEIYQILIDKYPDILLE